MARRSLAPHAQRHGGVVHKELAVNGSALAVSVLEEDAGRGGGGVGGGGGGRWRQVPGWPLCLRVPSSRRPRRGPMARTSAPLVPCNLICLLPLF